MRGTSWIIFCFDGAITQIFIDVGQGHSKSMNQSYFLDIILAFHRRSPSDFAKALTDFDTSALTVELVEHLLQYLPNENEVKREKQPLLIFCR